MNLARTKAQRGRTLLVVADSLASGLGGVVLSQVEWFTRRGWDVGVAGRVDERSVELPVHVFAIDLPLSARSVPELLAAVGRLGRLYRSFQPDIVHCHGVRSSLVAAFAGRRPVVHLHGLGPVPSDPPFYHGLRKIALNILRRISVGGVSASPGLGSNWVHQPDVSPRLQSLRRLPFPSGESVPTFLWLGRLEEQKRPDLFVRALAQVAQVKAVRGLIVGAGDLEPALRAQAQRLGAPVEFLGERKDIVPILEEAWALALLTRFEGMPLAVEEVMWTGRAVIGSRIPPLEWLIDGTGFLVDDVRGVVDAMMALSDPSLAERHGRAAADRVRALFPEGAAWRPVSALYDDIWRGRSDRQA